MTFAGFAYVVLIALLVIAHWQMGNKHPWAWLMAIGCRLGLIVFAAWTGAVALAPVASTFIIVDWRNFRKWRKDRMVSDRIATAIIEGEEIQ